MGHALRRRRGHCLALAGEPREDDVDHRARGRVVRAYGIGAEDRDHVHAAEGDGGVPIHGQCCRPDVQADGLVCLPWTDHHSGREGGQGNREPHLPSMEMLPPEWRGDVRQAASRQSAQDPASPGRSDRDAPIRVRRVEPDG